MTYVLKPHQQHIVSENPSRAPLALGTGTGKTLIAIRLMEKNKVKHFLVVCPKSMKQEWFRKHKEYGCKIPIFVLTKEEIKATYKDIGHFDAVVLDESHRVSNPKSGMYKAVFAYMKEHNPTYRYALSATPLTADAWSLFGLAKLLGYNPDYVNFRANFFSRVKMGPRTFWVQKKNIGDKAALFLQKMKAYTIELKDVTEVGKAVHEIEYIGLTDSQSKAIKKLELKETLPIVLNSKRHQIEQGCMKGDEFSEDAFFDSIKLDRIKELCEQNKKISIICRYNLQIDMLELLLADKYPLFIIRGGVKDVGKIAKEADSLDECVIIIQAEVSEGYELGHFDVIVFASISWSYTHYVQMLGRFVRLNHAEREKLFIHLNISGGIDEDVYKCTERGEDYYGKIYNVNKIV